MTRPLLLLAAALVALVGVTGLVVPAVLLQLGYYVATPVGVFVVAVFRVGLGFVLFQAAPASRFPTAMRVVGVVIMIAGFATPLFGVDRSRAMVDWMSNQGPTLVRLDAAFAVVVAVLLAYAVSPRRRLPA